MMTIVQQVFQDKPQRWGLRGDPFLWKELKDELTGRKIRSLGEFKDEVNSLYRYITRQGSFNEDRTIIKMGNYPREGMSGGLVSNSYWKEAAIPSLLSKFEELTILNYHPKDDISAMYSQGGMREYMRTGKYPEKLTFYSEVLSRTWTHNVNIDIKHGKVTTKGVVLFSYTFNKKTDSLEVLSNNGEKYDLLYQQVLSD